MKLRHHGPLLLIAAATIALLAYGPIAQHANYHQFADGSVVLGLPHAGDVLSNVGFAVVGFWGLMRLSRLRTHPAIVSGWPGYRLFLVSLVLTAAGSTFYHLAPDDARLVWDRIPIALACAGLLAAVSTESRPPADGRALTGALAVVAVASVLWWREQGDLRPYLLLQAAPLFLIPLWQALRDVDRSDRIAFATAIGLYVAAKAVELSDQALYAVLNPISGHTLKHLLAAAGAAVVVHRLIARTSAQPVLSATIGSTRVARRAGT